jgi:hypothetical protein
MSIREQQQESTSWELGLRPPTTGVWPKSLACIQTSMTTPGIHQDITTYTKLIIPLSLSAGKTFTG